jgi:hypothetical protein
MDSGEVSLGALENPIAVPSTARGRGDRQQQESGNGPHRAGAYALEEMSDEVPNVTA